MNLIEEHIKLTEEFKNELLSKAKTPAANYVAMAIIDDIIESALNKLIDYQLKHKNSTREYFNKNFKS